ncbi:HAD family hydrolase [Photobacterium carnosum]|uniref:HAD family hydrolase n=1 Tax=Photobacterium carnosum TaxID=2023717 RepID=UPI001E312256|nr:HAD family hydrolase [Photobacterium carnosum]MCD9496573.1 HAD-IB family hydrolase [Photobacterium carnosum]
MNNSAAFFDVDETLINMKSMFHFLHFWYQERKETDKLNSYMSKFMIEVKKGTTREKLNREYYLQFKGVKYSVLIEAGKKWFSEILDKDLFIDEAVLALKQHQSQNVTIVFISGSMMPVLLPIANHLGVKNVLCAPIIVGKDGILTGEIGTPQTIGQGKKASLITFCKERNIDPKNCYAYGDDSSDIPMLEITGHPICVGENSNLSSYAILNDWSII